MLRIQAAAVLMARATRLQAELELMKAENQNAIMTDQALRYGEEQYARIITDSRLSEDDIAQLFNSCEDNDASTGSHSSVRQASGQKSQRG